MNEDGAVRKLVREDLGGGGGRLLRRWTEWTAGRRVMMS